MDVVVFGRPEFDRTILQPYFGINDAKSYPISDGLAGMENGGSVDSEAFCEEGGLDL